MSAKVSASEILDICDSVVSLHERWRKENTGMVHPSFQRADLALQDAAKEQLLYEAEEVRYAARKAAK